MNNIDNTIKQIYDLNKITSCIKEVYEYMFDNSEINLKTWCQKLYKNGCLLVCFNKENEIKGLIGFYCNNKETKKAFISTLVIKENYRRQGLAKLLLGEMTKIAASNNMAEIDLKVNSKNNAAIHFYKKNGFKFISNENNYAIMNKQI